ncbi:lysozyme [Neorhizobium sp. NCHU2750]|uniref:lysozyme n=1 Tax=Neorhizobium sp. NCHU2750 TaxID=1825976 RepID=UPI000E75D06C|nr:lysozyme [Neorhizobium sp. NCHU2750]
MPTQPLNQKSKRAAAAIAGIAAVSVGGMVALFGGEKPVHDDVALASAALVQPWEGRSLKAYLDTIAKPPVWTICDGDTTNVKAGTIETPQGCNRRLAVKMERDYRAPLTQCINGWEGRPIAWRAMMLSLSWNIGTGAACNSTAAKLGRAGQYLASCNAATAFNKAGGKVIIGIVRRRENGDATRIGEGELCATGVSG